VADKVKRRWVLAFLVAMMLVGVAIGPYSHSGSPFHRIPDLADISPLALP
jgi:hypothetical protein